MFQTDAQWEEARYSTLLKELLQQPGLRRYPIIELPKTGSIIYVDVIFNGEDTERDTWTRYLCSTFEVAVHVLTRNNFSDARLHIQSFETEIQAYSIYPVTEIVLTIDEKDDHLLLYRRSDGRLYKEENNIAYSRSELRTSTIWRCNRNMSSQAKLKSIVD